MKYILSSTFLLLSSSALANQPINYHFANLTYEGIYSGCQMYRLNVPEGSSLLFGHNFNDTGPNAEGGASAGRIGMLSSMSSNPKYRSYSLRGAKSINQPAEYDSYTFMEISVGANSSPANNMLSQSKNVEKPTAYSIGATQLSMRFYDGNDQPRYTKTMPKYFSLCGNSIASFEALTSHKLRISNSPQNIKVQFINFNALTQLKASNDLSSEIQLSWHNADNTDNVIRNHKYTRISRAESIGNPQEYKFIELARISADSESYIDISSTENTLNSGKKYIYQVQYCDGYDFCEDNGFRVTGEVN